MEQIFNLQKYTTLCHNLQKTNSAYFSFRELYDFYKLCIFIGTYFIFSEIGLCNFNKIKNQI